MPSALTDGMVYTPLAVSEAAGLVATSALDSLSANVSADLWLVDIGGNREPARLAVEGLNIEAVWTPDSSRLLYFHADNLAQLLAGTNLELQSIAVDRSEAPLTLAEMTDLGRSWTLSAVSPDGSYAVGSWARTGTQSVDIWLLALDGLGDGNLATLDDLQFPLESGADEFDPAISPDGRWIAYSSDETGRHEIHVRRFPDFTGNYVVSLDGGTQPIWHPEGEELFYVSQGRMMVVRYASADTFDHEDPSVLFENPDLLRIASETATRAYGYHAATDRFVVNAPTGNAGPGQGVELSIVRNFASELAELAPWPERKL
jgi:Tol biopolymer transport system component